MVLISLSTRAQSIQCEHLHWLNTQDLWAHTRLDLRSEDPHQRDQKFIFLLFGEKFVIYRIAGNVFFVIYVRNQKTIMG